MPGANAPAPLSLADLEAFDLHPQGRDPERVYRCPRCASDERALHVNTQTGVYNCKRASCGISGKLTDFWEERPKMKRSEYARESLRRAFSLEAPQSKSEPATAATWREVWESSAPVARTRGAEYLSGRGIPEWIATAANVRFIGNLYNRTAILFPFGRDSLPVAFQARYIDGKPAAHRAMGPKSAGVFQTEPDALKRETVILCEAPIDALSLRVCGLPAVALGGTAPPDGLPKALAFKRVLIAFDNDANGAGDEAAHKLIAPLQSFGASVARLAPYRHEDADKSDWNMMLQEHGARLVCSHLRDELHQAGYSDWLALGRAEHSAEY